MTIDSVITGESLRDPPGHQCDGSGSDRPVGRPERDGSGTGDTFLVIRGRTNTGGRPPGGRLDRAPSVAPGPITSRTGRGRGPGVPGLRVLRLGPPAAAVSSPRLTGRQYPKVSSLMARGPSVPRVSSPVAHRPLVPIGQIPVAHRPSVPRPAPPARGPPTSESRPAVYWPSVAQSGAAGAGPGRTQWHAV